MELCGGGGGGDGAQRGTLNVAECDVLCLKVSDEP